MGLNSLNELVRGIPPIFSVFVSPLVYPNNLSATHSTLVSSGLFTRKAGFNNQETVRVGTEP